MLAAQRAAGLEFVLISPLRDDLPDEAEADWLPMVPGTDTALMLGIGAHAGGGGTARPRFPRRATASAIRAFEDYLLGRATVSRRMRPGPAAICGIAADDIVALARRMAGRRTADHRARNRCSAPSMASNRCGWRRVLAAMLGQIGLPGGGFGYALGSLAQYGQAGARGAAARRCRKGRNGVPDFIPVARIADMLLQPGDAFDYNGRRLTYPDITLVYWAGGNPFHHHQDLNRLRRAFARPDTVIVHDCAWTATRAPRRYRAAVHDDAGARRYRRRARTTRLMVAMHRVAAPFARGARRLRYLCRAGGAAGRCRSIHRGPQRADWLRHLYEQTRSGARRPAASTRPISTHSGGAGELTLPIGA